MSAEPFGVATEKVRGELQRLQSAGEPGMLCTAMPDGAERHFTVQLFRNSTQTDPLADVELRLPAGAIGAGSGYPWAPPEMKLLGAIRTIDPWCDATGEIDVKAMLAPAGWIAMSSSYQAQLLDALRHLRQLLNRAFPAPQPAAHSPAAPAPSPAFVVAAGPEPEPEHAGGGGGPAWRISSVRGRGRQCGGGMPGKILARMMNTTRAGADWRHAITPESLEAAILDIGERGPKTDHTGDFRGLGVFNLTSVRVRIVAVGDAANEDTVNNLAAYEDYPAERLEAAVWPHWRFGALTPPRPAVPHPAPDRPRRAGGDV
eukprot:COSAG04_NODE_5668_length_1534_cov_1.917770_1_plen_316_part_00